MTMLEKRGTLAEIDAAWERESQVTAKQQTPQEALKQTLACSR